ncbi:nucleotide exchange factor GrpE [Perlabentimonas gracilis]|uniref:nucleotide exchange factor GrpE n=1 Tax=Perlabentimonas gracilis TaxID=2715279 RepID=UPI00140C91B9|nr:nucleotide exchange factor GrpE [Perlabentimonas gracilis]NHB69453.1 nucleotide exchange factor GrpE [Perlabentimonas gracilis]
MSKKKTTKAKEQVEEKPEQEAGSQNDVTPESDDQSQENQLETEEPEVDPIEALQKQLDEAKDKYVRLSAEFDNFRKRTQREKMDLIRFGSEDVMKNILPLVDDFERAIKHTETATDIEAMKQGLVLIHGKFVDFLKNNGVKEIEAMGYELDTDKHDAITKIPAPDDTLKGKIVDVVEKGYMLNEKIIRFAKVVIGE